MFTGLVREVGTVVSFERRQARRRVRDERRRRATPSPSTASASPSSGRRRHARLRRRPGDARAHEAAFGERVNVEPALRAGEPLGGHYVQGHVDGVGTVTARRAGGRRACACGSTPTPDAAPLLRREGLDRRRRRLADVAALADGGFEVALVPHTLAQTTLGDARARRPGEPRGRRAREVRRAAARPDTHGAGER